MLESRGLDPSRGSGTILLPDVEISTAFPEDPPLRHLHILAESTRESPYCPIDHWPEPPSALLPATRAFSSILPASF